MVQGQEKVEHYNVFGSKCLPHETTRAAVVDTIGTWYNVRRYATRSIRFKLLALLHALPKRVIKMALLVVFFATRDGFQKCGLFLFNPSPVIRFKEKVQFLRTLIFPALDGMQLLPL